MSKSNNTAWSKLKGEDDFQHLDSPKIWQLVSLSCAETLGTMVVVALGCSGLVSSISGAESHFSFFNVVLTFSCAVSLAITIFGHISGAHINPAVSLSALIFGHLSLPMFLLYVASQCLGACLGIAIVKVLAPDNCTEDSFCVTLPNASVGTGRAVLAEAFLTGVLVWVCNSAWDRRCQNLNGSLPIKFGLAMIALALPGAKYSGASLNPARSFGPALLSGVWKDHWVYWLGPMGGSVVASLIYKSILSELDPPQLVKTPPPLDPEEEHPL